MRDGVGGGAESVRACEKYHKEGIYCKTRLWGALNLGETQWSRSLATISHVVAMAANIRDLKVWQEAVALGAEIVRCARQAARRETKVVTDQLMLTALSAAST